MVPTPCGGGGKAGHSVGLQGKGRRPPPCTRPSDPGASGHQAVPRARVLHSVRLLSTHVNVGPFTGFALVHPG